MNQQPFVRRLRHAAVWAAFACAAIAAPAGAAPAGAAPAGAAPQIRLVPQPAAPRALDLSRLASPYDAGQAMRAAGIARTSLDHSPRGAATTASVGFLCGGPPNTQTSGAAGALGIDRDGRFLGAQLRLGFR